MDCICWGYYRIQIKKAAHLSSFLDKIDSFN